MHGIFFSGRRISDFPVKRDLHLINKVTEGIYIIISIKREVFVTYYLYLLFLGGICYFKQNVTIIGTKHEASPPYVSLMINEKVSKIDTHCNVFYQSFHAIDFSFK